MSVIKLFKDKKVCSILEHTTQHGAIEGKTQAVNRQVSFYNLEAIFSVGYRVNSVRANHLMKK